MGLRTSVQTTFDLRGSLPMWAPEWAWCPMLNALGRLGRRRSAGRNGCALVTRGPAVASSPDRKGVISPGWTVSVVVRLVKLVGRGTITGSALV
jgi:hypothetical protein